MAKYLDLAGLLTVWSRIKDWVFSYASSQLAPINNANLLGTPTAPTATAGTNTTQIATTAFVYNTVEASKISYVSINTYADLPASGQIGVIYLVPGSIYTEVGFPAPGSNPKNMGWYERSGTEDNYVYTKTTDTSINYNKTYYLRGCDEYVWVGASVGYELLGQADINIDTITTSDINTIIENLYSNS